MTEHYFSEKQTSRLRISELSVNLRGNSFKICTGSGVFSKTRVDPGSELLIETAQVEKGWRLLDLGCGYGIVGIALKLSCPSIHVVFSDINERALSLTRKNLDINGVEGDVRKSDAYSNIPERFDTILLNPPQTAGKKLCYMMIEKAKDHLMEGGLLQIVARHKKGGESLSKKMEEVFRNLDVKAKKSGYRVYVSRNE